MKSKNIQIKDYIDNRYTALVGRESAQNLLTKLEKDGNNFKKLEEKFDKIVLIIPSKIITINKSFFLGLFETRIQDLGKEEFKKKYSFGTSEHIQKKVMGYLDSALLTASMKDIIDG